jgi:hypothetical protein
MKSEGMFFLNKGTIWDEKEQQYKKESNKNKEPIGLLNFV